MNDRELEDVTARFASALVMVVLARWEGADLDSRDVELTLEDYLRRELPYADRRRLQRELELVEDALAEALRHRIGVVSRVTGASVLNLSDAAARRVRRAAIDGSFEIPRTKFEAADDAAANEPQTFEQGVSLIAGDGLVLVGRMLADLPPAHSQEAKSLWAGDMRLAEQLRRAVSNTPAYAPDIEQESELAYRRALVERYDYLELFGLDLTSSTRRYSLSTSYVGLDIGDVGEGSDAPLQRVPVSQWLSERQRVLVVGDAGSGKTTLLQYLAVNIVRDQLPEELEWFSGLLPIFLRLRHFADRPLPDYRTLKGITATDLGVDDVDLDPGWLSSLTSTGMILLVDGLDELPRSKRLETAEWLEATLRYHECPCVLTSRPSAAAELPLASMLDVAEIAPMAPSDVNVFVTHWHAAVSRDLSKSAAQEVVSRGDDFLEQLATSFSLRRLCGTPLLCAVACALHLEASGVMPTNRNELYERALAMLVHRRDAERRVASGIGDRLGLNQTQKMAILQSLAAWFVRNDLSEAGRSAVRNHLTHLTSTMGLDGQAGDVLDYLIERTGILREPALGEVDFVHKTFLEFLAAQHFVGQADFNFLAKRGLDPAWSELVVMAAGLMGSEPRSALIANLLTGALGDKEAHARLRVAAECCGQGLPTEASVREDVESLVRSLIPPRSNGDARSLAELGETAIRHLGPSQSWSVREVGFCASALAAIGSPSAWKTLRTYFSADSWVEQSVSKRASAASVIQQFDRGVVIDECLSDADLEEVLLDVPAPHSDLSALLDVGRIGRLALRGTGLAVAIDWQSLGSLNRLSEVRLSGKNGFSFQDLDATPSVNKLALSDLELASVISDAVCPLTVLELTNVSGFSTVADLPAMPRLRELTLAHCEDLTGIEGIENCRALEVLDWGSLTFLDLGSLVDLPELHTVVLRDASAYVDLSWLTDQRKLSRLELVDCSGHISLPRGDFGGCTVVLESCGGLTQHTFDGVGALSKVIIDRPVGTVDLREVGVCDEVVVRGGDGPIWLPRELRRLTMDTTEIDRVRWGQGGAGRDAVVLG